MSLSPRKLFSSHIWSSGNRPWYGSFGVSTLFHLTLIVVLGFLWTLPTDTSALSSLETRWSPEELQTEFTLPEPLEKDLPEERAENGGREIGAVLNQPLSS